jgi:hypothetical protein
MLAKNPGFGLVMWDATCGWRHLILCSGLVYAKQAGADSSNRIGRVSAPHALADSTLGTLGCAVKHRPPVQWKSPARCCAVLWSIVWLLCALLAARVLPATWVDDTSALVGLSVDASCARQTSNS